MPPRSLKPSAIIVEAESGAVGSQFSIITEDGVTYAGIQTTIGGQNPTNAERVISFSVTFPSPGIYELYGRLRVGPATFDDDSFYYANGFGAKSPTSDADWITANGLAATVGFTLPSDKVVGGGTAQSNVWKWVKLSAFDGGEGPVSFTVDASSLTRTFQVAGRENGLRLDKFAFGRQGVFFTVFDLDNGLPGTTVPPPPPFTPTGPPIATGQPKFLGGVSSPSQALNFTAYWNQVTPENAGKWGSVENTRDVMSWGALDTAYALAKNNGFPFRMHTLIWGNQQPAWIEALPQAEQLEEIEEWFAAVATRYPDIDFIDVVNEPLHDPPDGPGDGNYIEALGGAGASGWEWVLRSFRLARLYFPTASWASTSSASPTTRPMPAVHRHHRAAAGRRADRHGRRAGTRVLDPVPNTCDHGQPRSPVDRGTAHLRHGARHRRPDRRGPARGLPADLPGASGSTPASAASRCGATGPATGAPRRGPTSSTRTEPSGPRWSGCRATSRPRRSGPGSRPSRIIADGHGRRHRVVRRGRRRHRAAQLEWRKNGVPITGNASAGPRS